MYGCAYQCGCDTPGSCVLCTPVTPEFGRSSTVERVDVAHEAAGSIPVGQPTTDQHRPQATWSMHVRDFPGLRLLCVERGPFDSDEVKTVLTLSRESEPERPLLTVVIDDERGFTDDLRERVRR